MGRGAPGSAAPVPRLLRLYGACWLRLFEGVYAEVVVQRVGAKLRVPRLRQLRRQQVRR